MYTQIDDDILSFHQGQTTIMYYNMKTDKITILAVHPAYKSWRPFDNKIYLFYDFINNIEESETTLMSYDTMINNVKFVFKYFNVHVPQNVKYVMT